MMRRLAQCEPHFHDCLPRTHPAVPCIFDRRRGHEFALWKRRCHGRNARWTTFDELKLKIIVLGCGGRQGAAVQIPGWNRKRRRRLLTGTDRSWHNAKIVNSWACDSRAGNAARN